MLCWGPVRFLLRDPSCLLVQPELPVSGLSSLSLGGLVVSEPPRPSFPLHPFGLSVLSPKQPSWARGCRRYFHLGGRGCWCCRCSCWRRPRALVWAPLSTCPAWRRLTSAKKEKRATSARWVRPGGPLGALSEWEVSLYRRSWGPRGRGRSSEWGLVQKRLGSARLWVGGSGTTLGGV